MPDEPELIDLDDIERVPYHLRENVPPLAVCDGCGRKSWNADEIGRACGMQQPPPLPVCAGKFTSRVKPDPDGPHARIVVVNAGDVSFFLPVPCGHPQDPVARWVHVNFIEPHETPLCHCGRVLNVALGHVVEGAPGPVVACDNCGCGVAIPPAPEPRG